MPAGLGMEINVDYLAVCLLDLAGTVRHRAHLTTDQRGRTPAQTWSGLSALAKAASKAAAAEGLAIVGATVALPGLVSGHSAGQEVKIAPNLGWHETPVPARIDGIAVTAGNEANLAAFGELHATGLSSFVYVSGEIGIGAGIVVNGDLFRGTQGWAGELGHVTVDPAGPQCTCGSQGCLEQYAGEDAIRSACGPGLDLELRARNADPATLKALEHAGTALGVALSSAVNLLDLPVVVLGSHLAPLVPWLKAPIERELKQRVITSRWSSPEVVPSALGADAAVIGAARTVTEAIIANPAAHLSSVSR
jgi:predicted NBD/HSP70 family sugar kinase